MLIQYNILHKFKFISTESNQMKSLFIFLIVASAITLNAQQLPQQVVDAISNDNAQSMSEFINAENVDVCYRLRGKMYSAFALSIKNEAKDCFKYLLDLGVDVNQFCSDKSPLMYAAKYGQTDMVIRRFPK